MRLSLHRVVALATFVLVACSGSYLATTQDAGTSVGVDASNPGADVTTLVPVADALPPVLADAGLDATLDAGPPSPCRRTNLFCDDFDDGLPIGSKWSSTQTAAGPFDLDDTLSVSRPRALRLQMTPGTGNRSSGLFRDIDITGDVKISVDARVDLPQTGTFFEIDPLIIGVSPASAGVGYQVFAICLYTDRVVWEAFRSFTDGGAASSTENVIATDGVYHHIVVYLRSGNGTTNATLEIDGTSVSTRSLPTETPKSISLQVGAPYTNNANAAVTVRVDNVIVERL